MTELKGTGAKPTTQTESDTIGAADFIALSAPASSVEGGISALFSKQAEVNQIVCRAKELFSQLAHALGYGAAHEMWTSPAMFELAAHLKKTGPSGPHDPVADWILVKTFLHLRAEFPSEPEPTVRRRTVERVKHYSPKRFASTPASIDKHLRRLLERTKPPTG